MFVVLRKFPEHKEWNICAVCATEDSAIEQVNKEIKSSREARYYSARNVYVAENGNHTWN